MPTITYDVKADFGAVGDGQIVTDAISIANGSTAFHTTSNVFVPTDTGKYLFFYYPAAFPTAPMFAGGQITYVSATQVTLTNAFTGATLTSSVRQIEFGHDDAPAFYENFNPAALTWQASHPGQIQLDIPAGIYVFGTHTFDPSFNNGVKQLLVNITSTATFAGLMYHLAGLGQYQDDAHVARTASVAAGSNFVDLLTPSLVSLFTVGQYAQMTGLNLQGNGYPSNQHWNEYLLVSAIDSNPVSPTYGRVTFATPLRHAYLSTWPDSGAPDSFTLAGAAALYAINPTWDTEVTYQGDLTITSPTPMDATGRDVTFDGTSFPGGAFTDSGQAGFFPTQNQSARLLNCDLSTCVVEADKLVTSIKIVNTLINVLGFQSSSIELLTVGAGSVIQLLLGTPKKTVIDAGATIERLIPGATNFGYSEELIIYGAVINQFDSGGALEAGTADAGVNNSPGVSMSNGAITIPRSYINSGGILGPPPWGVPGARLFWSDETGWIGDSFQVVGITGDATNVYVQTDWRGGFPTPPFNATKIRIRTHPAPKFTCRGAAGSDVQIPGFNVAPAGVPLFSYQRVTYTSGAAHAAAQPGYNVWGNLSSLSINVTHAYGGGGALTFAVGPSWPIINSLNNPGVTIFYDAVVNAKIAGERIVRLSGVTGSQSGDTGLAVPDPVETWFTGGNAGLGPAFSADVSGTDPNVAVVVTFQTDQGFGNTPFNLLVPDADDTQGGWTNDLGGLALYALIDENPADDVNYIRSSSSPVGDMCEVSLSDPVAVISQPARVQVRFRRQGDAPIDLTVRLMQGATQIAAWTYVGISTSFILQEETLTGPQFAAITDPTDLRLQFEATA